MFTFKNVYDKREEFIEACRVANACAGQFKLLSEAKTEEEFLDVICNNVAWVKRNVPMFEPTYSYIEYFYFSKSLEGYAIVHTPRVGFCHLHGAINRKGELVVPIKYKYVYEVKEEILELKNKEL